MEMINGDYSAFHLRKACQHIMELAQAGNAYFDAKKPWAFAKDPTKRAVLETAIAASISCIINLALASSPIIPETAQKIWRMLGFETELAKENWQKIRTMPHPAGMQLREPEILFRKMEDEEIEEQIAKLGKKEALMTTKTSLHPVKALIQFDQIEKLDLRIAQILEVVKVPKSTKLLKLFLDLGFEKRTVVSGIALSYEPDQLVGKKVILVANLAPATIMGIESQGMILSASFDSTLELPMIQELPPGSSVY
jgi:methionyl-tRNA synthetase